MKLPYFLKHIRMQRKDPALKQLRDIRFRDPKNLDCSRLVKYDGKNCIVGVHDTAPRRFFKNLPSSIRHDPSVKLSSLEKIVICIKTMPKRPRDLVHYFSFNRYFLGTSSVDFCLPRTGETRSETKLFRRAPKRPGKGDKTLLS